MCLWRKRFFRSDGTSMEGIYLSFKCFSQNPFRIELKLLILILSQKADDTV